MARALGLSLALVLLVAASAGALSGPSGELVAGSEETALRLHDLPPGYRLGDDGSCGPSIPGGEEGEPRGRLQKRFLKWSVRNWPEGCSYQYEQVFKVPGLGPAPPLVEVETLNTPSETAAREGFGLIDALVKRYEPEADHGELEIAPGTEARLLRSRKFNVGGRSHRPGTVLIWHFGTLISYLEVAGMDPRRNDRAALHFARIQQGRIEHPSPYTEEERDDREVFLDDPALKFPIYWVGRTYAPAGAPAAELEYAYAGTPGLPGVKFELEYGEFGIYGWTRASWKRFAKTRLGRLNLHARCTSKQPLPLEGGSAVLFATYDGRFRSCPERPPDRYYAIARLDGMVVGVNLGLCLSCRGGATGPYGSKRAVEAILEALVPRPKPAY